MPGRPPERAVVAVERLAGDSAELRDCFAIRRRVFVDEQGVPEALDRDVHDPGCIHFLARVAGSPVGTARLRRVDAAFKAERVGVLSEHRGRGVGEALMAALEADARAAGGREMVLHAQQKVARFYERLGYRRVGEVFVEAGIPHVAMVKHLA